MIVRLWNFLTSIWSKFPRETLQSIDLSFYDDNLIRLILICVLNPTQLGFDINNEEINKKLPERVFISLRFSHSIVCHSSPYFSS